MQNQQKIGPKNKIFMVIAPYSKKIPVEYASRQVQIFGALFLKQL